MKEMDTFICNLSRTLKNAEKLKRHHNQTANSGGNESKWTAVAPFRSLNASATLVARKIITFLSRNYSENQISQFPNELLTHRQTQQLSPYENVAGPSAETAARLIPPQELMMLT